MPSVVSVVPRLGTATVPGGILQSGWAEHAAYMDGLVEEGRIVLGGPVGDDFRTAHAVDADSEEAVRELWARDPWSRTHLVVESIEPWSIRLDGRGRG